MHFDPREIFGAPRPVLPEVRVPSAEYALNAHQYADWLSGEAARDEIRRVCRRWLRERPGLPFVEIRERARVVERVDRG